MATATLARQSISPAIPRSFKEVSEQSKKACGMRCGSPDFGPYGSRGRVSVFYFADKDGYRFGSVKAL